MTTTRRSPNRIAWIVLLSLLGMVAGCRRPSAPKTTSPEYRKAIEELRRAKDQVFREGAQSPLPAAVKSGFRGLAYYPVDADYRLEVTAKPYSNPETIEMLTSQGQAQSYIRYAYVDLVLNGQSVRANIYASKMADRRLHYFIPFKDKTSGTETYPAGRYLEVEIDPHWNAVIDFNQAYNPYCAYNHDYSCPIPPPENHLKIPIRAGERYIPSPESEKRTSDSGLRFSGSGLLKCFRFDG